MITNPQRTHPHADLASTERRRHRERRPNRLASRPAIIALVAIVLSIGGRFALAGTADVDSIPRDVAPAAVGPIDLAKARASKAAAHGFSARVLVSQAEADLAAGHPGLAILQYERARLLAPRAPAIAVGLARARAIASLPSAEPTLARRVAQLLGADEWGWIGMAGLILAAAGVVAFSWDLIRRRGFVALAVVGAGIASAGFLTAIQVTPPPTRAVVVVPDEVARIAPFAQADQAFAVPEGAVVTVERTYQDYALVGGSEGRGWIPSKGLEIILPAPG
jgi:hypothetical protein